MKLVRLFLLCVFCGLCGANNAFGDEIPIVNIEIDEADEVDLAIIDEIDSQDGSARYRVAAKAFSWYDASRRRHLPVRILYPVMTNGQKGSTQKMPVIIFSHGLGGSYNSCAYLGTVWASRGFVTVFIEHVGFDESVWQGTIRPMQALRDAYEQCKTGRIHARDVKFVLNRLERLSTENEFFGKMLDLDRIGVGGYDIGSLGALLVAGQLPPDRGSSLRDERVKAVLAMSPPIHPPLGNYRNVYANITVPALFVTGTEDDGIVGTTLASQRRIPFDSMASRPRFLVTYDGADHRIYSGHTLSWRGRNDHVFQASICRVTALYWQGYLRGDADAQAALGNYGLNVTVGLKASVERRLPQQTVSR